MFSLTSQIRHFAAAILILAATAAPAAESVGTAKRHFRLPAGEAAQSLKEFAEESSVDVLFVTDMVAGVRTQEVEGEFYPPEAMDRLLAGTGLVAVQNPKTASFTISRTSAASAAPDSPTSKKKRQ